MNYLVSCAWCGKVHLYVWIRIDEKAKSEYKLSHGRCPHCYYKKMLDK